MLGVYGADSAKESVVRDSVRAKEEAGGESRLFSCIVDGLAYPTLDTALIHVRIQHRVMLHGEMFVRAKLIGGVR